MKRTTLILALSAAFLPGLALAEDTTVYKSKGASGETVYTQVETVNSSQHRVGIDTSTGAKAEATPAAAPKSAEQLACERAKLNLDVLSSKQDVSFDRDGDGKPETMTAEERASNSEIAKRQVGAFCEPAKQE